MFPSDSQIASYPFYLKESDGGTSWPNFNVVNVSPTNQQPDKPLRLGQLVLDRDGNFFQLVKATAGLTIGQVVKPSVNLTCNTQAATAAADNIHIIKTDLSGRTLNELVGAFLIIKVSATSTVVRRIKGNTATAGGSTSITISQKDIRFGRGDYDADYLASALGAGILCEVYRPWHVQVAGAGDFPVGVAQGTVTSGNITAIQVHGHGLVASDGTTVTALTDNGLVITGASGAVTGPVAAPTGTQAQAAALSSVGISKLANSAAAGAFSEILVQCFGRW